MNDVVLKFRIIPSVFYAPVFIRSIKKMFFTLRIFHTLACRTIYRRLPNACREN
ncbi:hypothetical protein LEP1GSC103_2412 [Leptospira borgpetersenii serovar Javanica str. UI 09931]|uniref:Uncharacterized protein n=3 Tax=Leptospira borgpetersenii TaxID=174 RepID=M3HRK0_LEPBO|nr:hypothetical protein LEP1GSC128_3737 [Leptospira borgpetersenii str. 200801926]EKQ93978.1 hypothetical protein LEP1GSC101_1921 [Leptospira borgpetersenii str. UI 09149]EMG00701.1 hypothetical protein LEP1GSC123_1980 [Leptospira borgpetersenii str. 200701203]EMK12064.1 hypothetical protein LEP1GSC066_2300 [Leptospira sp. serovar Kenya str. Sh9]EMN13181.1 hypothetical protein LEP1GSC055_0639 [Leptospira borgpetersenii str. Brem 307]EMN57500.1 hypothetical protein LEP1GSC090_2518 [Leptospira b